MEVFRLILETSPGRVDTGATYQGCSRQNADACQPAQFATVQDAIAFAKQRGEIPVKVPSADVAWMIVEGNYPISDSMIITDSGLPVDPKTLLIVGAAAVVILPMLLKRRGGAS